MIRPLIPIFYPDEVCLISDIDWIPLSRWFYVDQIVDIPDDHFVVLEQYGQLPGQHCELLRNRYMMSFILAKGATFQEIFPVNSLNDIDQLMREWNKLPYGICTDEKITYKYINDWKDFETRTTLLYHEDYYSHAMGTSINFNFDKEKFVNFHYWTWDLPRPYFRYKKKIDYWVDLLLTASYGYIPK